MGAQARPRAVTGTATVFTGPCTYRGFWLASAAGADVTIYDGTSAAGTVLAKLTLAAGASASEDIAEGLRCDLGVHLVASAAVEGHVRIG